jgi:hypothetical protein
LTHGHGSSNNPGWVVSRLDGTNIFFKIILIKYVGLKDA